MEIQLDPRGIRLRTSAGWLSFAPTDTVEAIIAALIEDRQGKAFVPTDAIGTATTRPDVSDTRTVEAKLYGGIEPYRPAGWRKAGPGQPLVRVMPADPKLRRPKPKRQAIGMSLDELLS